MDGEFKISVSMSKGFVELSIPSPMMLTVLLKVMIPTLNCSWLLKSASSSEINAV